MPSRVNDCSLVLSCLRAPDGKVRLARGWGSCGFTASHGQAGMQHNAGLGPGLQEQRSPGALVPGQPGTLKAGGDPGRKSKSRI